MPATRMQAIVCTQYGPPETLTLQEVATPAIGADGVLVRVRAASVNPADFHTVGGGLVVRLVAGLRRPRQPIPGTDVAGVVEAVGKDVSAFQPGDAVFGGRSGALAEYVAGVERNFVPKPATVSFEQAAAVAIAGVTALQGLRDKGRLQPGQSVLINGAAGGVGTFAVQIATALGGTVTGVCSTPNVELVRSLGAARVIDYTQEDFAQSEQRYDLVLDLVGNRSLADLRRVVTGRGTLVLSGGGHARGHGGSGLQPLMLGARGLLLSRFVGQDIAWFIANINQADLTTLKELMDVGKLTPVIDRTYPLSQTAAALRYLQAGHARGKVVITV
jgi:NADPH:quinone reductase-like Zn-dependent oxidoreductase